jgi:hypothetical protein
VSVSRAGSRFIIPRRPFDCEYWSTTTEHRGSYRLVDLEQWTEDEVLAGSLSGPIVRVPDNVQLVGSEPTQAADPTTAALLDASAAIADEFDALADEWDRETILEALPSRMAMHLAYQRIIGLGPPAVPLILRRLEVEPNYWFWALTAITGQDPAKGETTLEDATARWLEWGREHELLA